MSAVYPSYLESFVEKAYLIGFLASLIYLIQLPVSIPVGAFSDLVGRKKLLLTGLSVFTGVELLYYLNEYLAALIILQLAVGILMITVFVTSEAFIRDISPISRRGAIRSFFGTWITAGYLFGPIIGGWIGDNYSIRMPFLISAILMLLSLILLSGVKDEHRSQVAVRDKPIKEKISFFKPLKRFLSLGGGVRYLFINAIILYFWYVTKWIYAPLFLLYLGYDLGIVGIWLGVSLIPLILFQIPAGILGDRIGKERMITIGVLISAISIAPLGFISDLDGLILIILIISTGSAFIEPLINAKITDLIPKENYGECSGVFEAAKITGCISGPIVTGIIVDLAGFEYAFIPSAILFLFLLIYDVTGHGKN
ncbi:MAG: multidrug-efflux transporter [Candidatus Syntrophoarchaeum caldarius]|uniref:Multidrug-efflux transporter n=1 Tax=Candidatus Syntropharchaeum caldarium TaxID=1838285 RepID=A0A1F2PAY6_9EURY|nr:MAG: multidrug-efflux transporter [Candidatus Syntrophoarchaeum caldarius]